MNKQSYYIPVTKDDELHIHRLSNKQQGPVVLMIHGSIENGRIFYSNSDRGLGPFLAKAGYDVFIPDLRGRGKSRPAINRYASYGQTQVITEDIPAILNFIKQERGETPQFWVTHSWGGVLTSSYLARFPEHIHLVKAMVYFAAKRSVRVQNLEKFFKVDFLWKTIAPLIIAAKGYLPARECGFGSDNETKKSYYQNKAWVKPQPWIDPEDGFDYGNALKKIVLPPTLYIAGAGDKSLGHPDDVRRLLEESGQHTAKLVRLSKDNGHSDDYDHISILTATTAASEQYQICLDWFKKYYT